MLYISGKIRKLDLISVVLIVLAAIISLSMIKNYYSDQITRYRTEAVLYKEALDRLKVKISVPRYPFATNYEKKDYHDYEFIQMEATQEGPGEQGRKYELSEPDDVERNNELKKNLGFSAVVSDHISVNRSLSDVRLHSCKTKKYLKQLSKVSIVIVFHNEYWSVLLRTIHSIYNRTPLELLHEIILVNDNSTMAELYQPLQDYVKNNFYGLVKILTMTEKTGLVYGRLEGARLAIGDVLVFLDAQVEVNVNWLPPLLEPIALNPRVITTPIVDSIAFDTFEYRKLDDGGRGIFNWNLHYRRFPRRPQDSVNLDEPIPSPVMVGSAFAIYRRFFWDIGSFDDGLKVWQGEQLELSLKAHLCGVGMVEVPCSRVARSPRNKHYYKRFGGDGEDYMIRNLKRIAEVWMDDYRGVVYDRNKQKYDQVDVGDLMRAKAIKRGLHCNPFTYFLGFVAPEVLERYPLEDPGYFAKGAIQSKTNPTLCVEVSSPGRNKISLNICEKNLVDPSPKQFFKLAWHRNIQHSNFDFCIPSSLMMSECHFSGGNQLWKYDLMTSQILQPAKNVSKCLTAKVDSRIISLEVCDSSDINQKWNWGDKNISASWDAFGVDLATLSF